MTEITQHGTRPSAAQLQAADTPHDDPVVAGIRAWDALKKQALDAVERADKAEKEADYLRGQNDLLLVQHQQSRQENKMLRGEIDEVKTGVAGILGQCAELAQRMSLGAYRQAGSREVTPSDQMESDMADLTAKLGQKFGADSRQNDEGREP